MKIAVIGTGYVGLVTGVCLAETGNKLCCIDINEDKVKMLSHGKCPIYEPGLEVLLTRNLEQQRIQFSTQIEDISGAEIIFLALPTPPGGDGAADLSYVLTAAGDLSKHITNYTIIVNKSTVPVGTAKRVTEVIGSKVDRSLFDVVSNPEFLKEGVAVNDFMKPERIVIGSDTDQATIKMKQLYEPFVRQGNPIITMSVASAELTKYAANSFLATKISFMNEIANLCERVGANVDDIRRGIGTDSRIGRRFLFPGVGYGGSCFPKDVQALDQIALEQEYDFKILKAVMHVNDLQRMVLAKKVKSVLGEDLSGKRIGVWGLSFKPNTDDIREAPALYILKDLVSHGSIIQAYDPEAMANFSKVMSEGIDFCKNPYQAVLDVDALVIITEWNVFRTPDYSKMKKMMKYPIIFDGRNVFDPHQMMQHGFEYHSIGRPNLI